MTPTDKLDDQAAEYYSNRIANPILRDMWPSISRTEIFEFIHAAFLSGAAHGRAQEKIRAEVLIKRLEECCACSNRGFVFIRCNFCDVLSRYEEEGK